MGTTFFLNRTACCLILVHTCVVVLVSLVVPTSTPSQQHHRDKHREQSQAQNPTAGGRSSEAMAAPSLLSGLGASPLPCLPFFCCRRSLACAFLCDWLVCAWLQTSLFESRLPWAAGLCSWQLPGQSDSPAHLCFRECALAKFSPCSCLILFQL